MSARKLSSNERQEALGAPAVIAITRETPDQEMLLADGLQKDRRDHEKDGKQQLRVEAQFQSRQQQDVSAVNRMPDVPVKTVRDERGLRDLARGLDVGPAVSQL